MCIRKIVLFCFIVYVLPVLVCANTSQVPDVVITQQRYNVPVLKLKKDNPVARIHIHIDSAGKLAQLSEMTFSTTGTTDLKDIKQLRLYYAGADSGYRNLASVDKIQLIGSADKPAPKLVIKSNHSLSPGDHYLWLSAELNDNASLLHTIVVNAVSAVVNGRSIKIGGQSKLQQRTGVALRQHNQDSV